MRSVIIVANGIRKDNVRLQPWRYVFEIAKSLANDYNVTVITDGVNDECQWDEGFTVVQTTDLGVKRQSALSELVRHYKPDILFWSTTTRSIVYRRLLQSLDCKIIPFITSPLYTWREMLRSIRAGVPFRETGALWKQRLIPRFLFTRFLNSKVFPVIVVQSENNRRILEKAGVEPGKLVVIPVGLDKDIQPETTKKKQNCDLLYLGALRKIRGFYAFQAIWPELVKQKPDIRIRVLARGDEPGKENEASQFCEQHGLAENVEIISGWLSKDEVNQHIASCKAVVLPFILVPSDVPIAVLEALAAGKPVIGGDVDGVPGLVRHNGVVVNPLVQKEFIDACIRCAGDNYTANREETGFIYQSWSQVGEAVQNMIGKSV